MTNGKSALPTPSVETPDVVLAAAREYVREGRASHVFWAEHLEAHADGTCESCTPEVIATAGAAALVAIFNL